MGGGIFVELRLASPADLPHVISMRMAYLTDTHATLTETETAALQQQLPLYFQRHMGQDCFAYLAFDGGRPVASAYLLMMERPANPDFITGTIAVLLNVYTDPAYRRHGLASSLIKMAIAEAGAQHASYIELQATAMGAPVYETLGFRYTVTQCTGMVYRFGGPGDGTDSQP